MTEMRLRTPLGGRRCQCASSLDDLIAERGRRDLGRTRHLPREIVRHALRS